MAKVVATSVVWRRGGAPKRLSACPPLEIIDRAMPLIFVGPRHIKYGLLILTTSLSGIMCVEFGCTTMTRLSQEQL